MKDWLSPIVVSFVLASGFPCQADEVEDRLVEASTRIEFISYPYFCIAQLAHPFGSAEPRVQNAAKALKEALLVPATFEQLEKLAGHPNPRVRTLALMKLYDLREHDAFPVIAKHLDDQGESFPDVEVSYTGKRDEVWITTEKATVGRVASRMLSMIDYPPASGDRKASFETWSKPRLGNPDWVGWYDFLYRVATGSTSPVQPEAAPRLAALREKLAGCPAAFRTWFWFGIADDCLMQPAYDTPFATEAEMVEAGRKLGPKILLAFLKDGTRSGLRDPYIDQPERGKRFILQHAKQLFREEDSNRLAEMGYHIAAADANPKEASILIRRGGFQGYEAGLAMAALLDHRSEAETEYVVKWFYDTPGAFRASSYQSGFIHEYERRRPVDWEKPIRALVAHPGFERLDSLDVAYLGQMVNKLAQKEVASFSSEGGEIATRNRLREYFGLPVVNHPTLDSSAVRASESLWNVPLDIMPFSAALSPDGTTIAIGGREGKIILMAADKGTVAAELPAGGSNLQVKFRKSDGTLLVSDERGILSEWDVAKRKLIRETRVHEAYSRSVLSEAGDLLVTDIFGGPALYDLKESRRRWQYKLNMGADGIIAFSPDGARLAITSGSSPTILLFDPASAEPIARLEGHSSVPFRALFSPDGKQLVSVAHDDMKVIVWDALTGRLVREFSDSNSRSYNYPLGFADSPARVVITDGREKVSFFDLSSGKADLSFKLAGSWAVGMFPVQGGKRWIGVETEFHQEDVEAGRVECWSAEPQH